MMSRNKEKTGDKEPMAHRKPFNCLFDKECRFKKGRLCMAETASLCPYNIFREI